MEIIENPFRQNNVAMQIFVVAGEMLTCPACGDVCPSAKGYVAHYVVHRNDANRHFPCPYSECDKKYNCYRGFKTHVLRKHRKERAQTENNDRPMCDSSFVCTRPLCGKRVTGSSKFLTHLRLHAKNEEEIKCPFADCDAGPYKNLNAFKSHIRRKHQNYVIHQFRPENKQETDTHDPTVLNDNDDESLPNDIHDGSDSHDDIPIIDDELMASSIALFYMRLESKLLVPVTTIDQIVAEITTISDLESQRSTHELERVLLSVTLAEQDRKDIHDRLSNGSSMSRVNTNCFLSNKLRRKYYKEKFNYVSPKLIYLGKNTYLKNCHYHYVPVEETLKQLLSKVDRNVLNSRPNNPVDLLCDVRDGELFQGKTYSSSPNTLTLLLYQDSFEVVNPLGSSRVIHKLLGVYYTVLNLPAEFRSKIDQLQVALLCKENHVKQFQFATIFKVLIRELKRIQQQGVVIKGIKYGVEVLCIAGDNLGSHQLGGFVESFNINNFCRFCDISRDQFTECPHFLGNPRTKETYDNDIVNYELQGLNKGVKSNSVFNQLKNFHVTDPGLPPCIAHDLFEGIVNQDVFLCIEHFVKEKKYFTFDDLNRNIKEFPFRRGDKTTVPAPVNHKGKKLGGQAIQNYHFIVFMPLLIGLHIDDKENEVWQMLHLLHQLVLYIMAPKISRNDCTHLNLITREYLEFRQKLFPDKTMKPKHHYIAHYADLILKFGPLRNVWTMRFESKHSYFKRSMRSAKNFINISSTLSEKHQLLQAYLQSGNSFAEEDGTKGLQEFQLHVFSHAIQEAITAVLPNLTGISTASQVQHSGLVYAPEMCLIVTAEGNYPTEVVKIMMILHIQGVSYIVGQVHGLTHAANNHMFAVHNMHTATVCKNIESLTDPHPLEIYTIDFVDYIVIKHIMPDI